MASPFAILPLPSSRFRPLAPYCPLSWHLTAKTPPPAGTLLLPPLWLAPYCYSPAGTLLLTFLPGWHPLCWVAPLALLPLRSFDPSSLTASPGIPLPPWLLTNAFDRCNDLHNRASRSCGPTVSVFSRAGDHLSSPSGPERAF